MFTGVGFVFTTRSDNKAISSGRSYEARLALEEPSLGRLTYLQMWRSRAQPSQQVPFSTCHHPIATAHPPPFRAPEQCE